MQPVRFSVAYLNPNVEVNILFQIICMNIKEYSMRFRHAKTLITGKSGLGKTTPVQKIIKMGLFSSHFKNLVPHALDADKQVLTTISLKGNDFIREIKQRLDIHGLTVL